MANSWISTGAPTGVILRVLGLKKSTFYRWKSLEDQCIKPVKQKEGVIPGFSYTFEGVKINDLLIQKYIVEILDDDIGKFYGYKKVTYYLRRTKNIRISKKKVFRLMLALNLIKKKRKRSRQYTRVCKNHIVSESNVLWELDTKYVYIAGTRRVAYLASIIDVFDRSIISYELSLSPDAESAKRVLLKALFNRGIKNNSKGLTVRTDNGSQFIAFEFEKLCLKEEIVHERIPPHSPNYNAHIESYHRYLQDECLSGKLFMTLEDAENTISTYVYGYNNKRIHSSIDYRTPNEFYNLKNNVFKNNLAVKL